MTGNHGRSNSEIFKQVLQDEARNRRAEEHEEWQQDCRQAAKRELDPGKLPDQMMTMMMTIMMITTIIKCLFKVDFLIQRTRKGSNKGKLKLKATKIYKAKT